jgi:hypothetical protein
MNSMAGRGRSRPQRWPGSWSPAAARGQPVYAGLVDFKRAFDSVDGPPCGHACRLWRSGSGLWSSSLQFT